jgi:hypothetical protein
METFLPPHAWKGENLQHIEKLNWLPRNFQGSQFRAHLKQAAYLELCMER